MIVITPVPGEVTGHAAQMYADDVAEDGFVFAHTAALAINPEAHAAFENLLRAIVPSIGLRTYELATLGAARAIPSPHCLLAHGRNVLRADVLDEQTLAQVARGDDSSLPAQDAAVVRYAESLSTRPETMTDADTQELRDNGFDDRQIVDITLAAAARNYLSRALRALAVPIDEVPGISPALREALIGSRPRT
ncbi:carboxymuconolactone decarboxylase family protein [Microbacterium sp. P05]|uniref:carboxymuconolactone decarboxylase family protein n=1 Tax=Microbacterium sp. P05 TaxID=3366948 RepID=UPI003746DE8E